MIEKVAQYYVLLGVTLTHTHTELTQQNVAYSTFNSIRYGCQDAHLWIDKTIFIILM